MQFIYNQIFTIHNFWFYFLPFIGLLLVTIAVIKLKQRKTLAAEQSHKLQPAESIIVLKSLTSKHGVLSQKN